MIRILHIGYFMVVRKCGFCVRMARTISHYQSGMSKISFLPGEHKIHKYLRTTV